MWIWVVAACFLVVGVVLVAGVGRALPIVANRQKYDVQEIPGFLTAEECAHIIEKARPVLTKSTVIRDGEFGHEEEDRTSTSAFLDHAKDPMLEGIKKRVAELTKTDPRQQEGIQVTHYEAGEQFGLHFDALTSNDADTGEMGDRIYTVIFYLNDDYKGGATYFPKIDRRVKPQKGKAVFFGNLTPDGNTYEPLALHSGEEVKRGEKWLVNQWIREKRANRKFRRSQRYTKAAKTKKGAHR